MRFQIGETVIHPMHGIGVIIGLDEMKEGEQARLYYVIAGRDKLTLWVPVDTAAKCGLRPVVSASGFTTLLEVLSSSAQPLSEQHAERQTEIAARFNEGTPEATCSIIRDLTARSLTKRLNETDTRMLKRARELLLDEWVLAMHVRYQEAHSQLSALLSVLLNESTAPSG
jgi:CarD family transcriptional regulator